ncbi:hypothetical protein FQN54_008291 [Arachnomyces sp. PD_36]|nr:hypothetical protein FQN54_008291 [Arachnomyces sp. PD_36]
MILITRFLNLLGCHPANDSFHHFETSWLLPPVLLASIRSLFSLYAFVTIFFIFGWNGSHNDDDDSRRSFSYFTWLSFWGVAFYFLVAAIHTFLYAATGRSVVFDKCPRVVRVLHSIFYATVTTFPFIVTIVYWAILYEDPWFPVTFEAWTNVSQHALPPFLSLFEIIFSTTLPPHILHLPFLIFILALYVSLAYLTHATQGFYTYSFLDPEENSSGLVAGYCFGILAGVIVVFGVVWLMHWGRQKAVGGKVKWARKDTENWNRGVQREVVQYTKETVGQV